MVAVIDMAAQVAELLVATSVVSVISVAKPEVAKYMGPGAEPFVEIFIVPVVELSPFTAVEQFVDPDFISWNSLGSDLELFLYWVQHCYCPEMHPELLGTGYHIHYHT